MPIHWCARVHTKHVHKLQHEYYIDIHNLCIISSIVMLINVYSVNS